MTRARDLADSADKDIAGTITLDAVNASGVITGLTVEATGDTAAGDNAAMGYTAAEGLILTGQGSTNDVTIKNDADADVIEIPTGTTNVTIVGNLGAGGTVTGTGTSVFASLDISGDIDVDGVTNLDVVDIDGAVDMASTLTVGGNITRGGTVITDGTITDTGDFKIDAAADIFLDAGGTEIFFQNAGTNFGKILSSGSDMFIQSTRANGDTVFRGNVGGTDNVTAMTLDYGDAASVYIANKLNKGFIQPNAAFAQTASANNNYWKLGRLYVYGPGGAKLVLYGKAGYSTGGNNEGETILLMRGTTSATALDGVFTSHGAIGPGARAMGYVPVSGSNYTFDIYAALGNFHSLDHEVVTSGTWATDVSNTGSTSAPTGYVAFQTENTVMLGTTESYRINQTSFYINSNAVDMDFRVSSDTFTNALFIDGANGNSHFDSRLGIGKSAAGESQSAGSGYYFVPGADGYYSHVSTVNTGNFSSYFNRKGTAGGFFNFVVDDAGVGGVTYNGSATVYATSSDYRLKENINYNFNATEKLKQLKPAEYRWIKSQMEDIGFIAHEVAEIVPNAVTGKKDAVDKNGKIDPQGYDPAKLVPLLVKTIQELEARITALEA